MRPISGGPFKAARDGYVYEPKYNGWRALVHIETGAMFNRKGERLSIEKEFTSALDQMRRTLDAEAFKWADCEALERRHKLATGSLIVLDAVAPGYTYAERRSWLAAVLPQLVISLPNQIAIAPHVDPTTGWAELQEINRRLGAEFYEGVVGKRLDSRYEIQLRSPDQESTAWIKHRWRF